MGRLPNTAYKQMHTLVGERYDLSQPLPGFKEYVTNQSSHERVLNALMYARLIDNSPSRRSWEGLVPYEMILGNLDDIAHACIRLPQNIGISNAEWVDVGAFVYNRSTIKQPKQLELQTKEIVDGKFCMYQDVPFFVPSGSDARVMSLLYKF